MMADVVEASLDVSLDDPLIWEPWLVALLVALGAEEHPKMLQRSVNRFARPKAIRNGKDVSRRDAVYPSRSPAAVARDPREGHLASCGGQ